MKKPKPPAHDTRADSAEAVEAFMAELAHPCKAEIQSLRKIIVGAHPSITEGVKWNAPSFRTTEYFATTHLRAKSGVVLVLHLGAKVRALPDGGVAIEDPAGMLKWLGKDRAMVEFRDAGEITSGKVALQALIRQWIAHV